MRTSESLLPVIVETVTTALKLPYVAITIRQRQRDVMRASYGEVQTPTHIIPLIYQNERVGQLVVGQRSPGEPLRRHALSTHSSSTLLSNGLVRKVNTPRFVASTASGMVPWAVSMITGKVGWRS